MNVDEIDSPVCLNCGSTNFFRDGESDDLICSDCNTQSQSHSQRETAEDADGTTTTNRRSSSVPVRSSKRSIAVVEEEIEEDYRVPNLMECTEAFLELVESAARKSVSEDVLPNLGHMEGFENYKEQIVKDAREICFLFLERWDEAANYFMINYQGIRISLLDRFLPSSLRVVLWKHMNQSCSKISGNGNDKWGESIDEEEGEESAESQESQSNIQSPPSKSPKRVKWDDSQSTLVFDSQQSSIHTPPKPKLDEFQTSPNFRQLQKAKDGPMDSWGKLKKMIAKKGMKLKDETIYLKLAIIELDPDLNLATSIVYLAHLCSQTGVVSNHFVAWANMGKFPHLLDAFGQLSDRNQVKLRNVKKKWRQIQRHLPNPDQFDRIAITLLTCLVDPKETGATFLSEQYELNVDRMENLAFLEKSHFPKLLEEKKKRLKERMKCSDHSVAKAQAFDQHKNDDDCDSEQNSPIRAFHLGQFSQESEGSLNYPDIPATFYNVGLMANLSCTYLGVDNRVLDFTYALMGLPVYYDCEEGDYQHDWLPAPLMLAQPSFIVSPLHLIAVIVAAIKFVPGWEESVIKINVDRHEVSNNTNKFAQNDDDDFSSQSEDEVLLSSRNIKRKRLETDESNKASAQAAASSASNLGQIRFRDSNGDKAFDYLDFMSMDESRGSITAELKGALSYLPNVASLEKQHKRAVTGFSILSSGGEKKKKSMSKKLQSSMGLSQYYAHKENGCVRYPDLNVVGVYKPYAVLISYFSERLAVNKKQLHHLVCRLDNEIIQSAEMVSQSSNSTKRQKC